MECRYDRSQDRYVFTGVDREWLKGAKVQFRQHFDCQVEVAGARPDNLWQGDNPLELFVDASTVVLTGETAYNDLIGHYPERRPLREVADAVIPSFLERWNEYTAERYEEIKGGKKNVV